MEKIQEEATSCRDQKLSSEVLLVFILNLGRKCTYARSNQQANSDQILVPLWKFHVFLNNNNLFCIPACGPSALQLQKCQQYVCGSLAAKTMLVSILWFTGVYGKAGSWASSNNSCVLKFSSSSFLPNKFLEICLMTCEVIYIYGYSGTWSSKRLTKCLLEMFIMHLFNTDCLSVY